MTATRFLVPVSCEPLDAASDCVPGFGADVIATTSGCVVCGGERVTYGTAVLPGGYEVRTTSPCSACNATSPFPRPASFGDYAPSTFAPSERELYGMSHSELRDEVRQLRCVSACWRETAQTVRKAQLDERERTNAALELAAKFVETCVCHVGAQRAASQLRALVK